MKKTLTFFQNTILSSLVFLGVSLYAKPVSVNDANNVALNWMHEKTGKVFHISDKKVQSTLSLNPVFNSSTYRIILLEPRGWVIVSSDDVAKPVIGYGLSKINEQSVPIAFSTWMKGVENGISEGIKLSKSLKSNQIPLATKIKSEWDRLRKENNQSVNTVAPTSADDDDYIVKPLLWLGGDDEDSGILWNQGKYYNEKCPEDSDGDDDHVWVGCVATAVGQIMRYHKAPTTGNDSHSYDCSTDNGCEKDYGVQSADFGHTTYDWDNMPVQLNDYNDDVSTLLYHIGVSVDMMYGSNGSGAYSSDAASALENYFGYDASYKQRDDYSDSDWHQMIQNSLDDHQPLYYAGFGDDGGHAFVLDGYDEDDYYHFNWGWSGYYNGKFIIDDLSPGDYNFSDSQEAIFIVPPASIHADAGDDQTVMVGDSVTLDASGSTDDNGTINKWEWKEGDTLLSTEESFTKDDFTTGEHTIILTVSDDNNNTDIDSVVITVKTTLHANAGKDQTIMLGDSVTLDASGSTDNSGNINKWEWREGNTLLSTDEVFTKDNFSIGTHIVVLTVGDDNNDTDSDTVVVTVSEPQTEDITTDTSSSGGGALDYLLPLLGIFMLFFRQTNTKI